MTPCNFLEDSLQAAQDVRKGHQKKTGSHKGSGRWAKLVNEITLSGYRACFT
jgi:hypothetical protein